MAATVLNGTGNVSWTNNTGGNVRVIINYFGANSADGTTNGKGITMNVGGATISAQYTKVIGKNLGLHSGSLPSGNIAAFGQNLTVSSEDFTAEQALPVEFYLASTQRITITLTGGTASYSIVIIPENG